MRIITRIFEHRHIHCSHFARTPLCKEGELLDLKSCLSTINMSVHIDGVLLILGFLSHTIHTRDIVFPPVAGIAPQQGIFSPVDDVDIVSGSQFAGLTTFSNLPYTNCYEDTRNVEKYDIAFVGAPFDTVSLERSHLIRL